MDQQEESNTGKLPQDNPTQSTNNTKSKRKGKGAQQRSTDKFRDRRNDQQFKAFRNETAEKYGLLQADDGPLKAALDNISIVAQPVAAPLSVTSRGVGVAVAVAYSRACTTWDFGAVSAVATIHQVYRVSLMCFHMKVYLAQQIQVESAAVGGAFRRLVVQDELREIIVQISQVPSVLALVLDCVGKIEYEGRVWHMGYPTTVSCDSAIEYRYLTLSPDTIRDTLTWLANPDTPEAERNEFIAHNPIPGAQYVAGLLLNADMIWPLEYTSDMVRHDVHCFKNWITRVESRLPAHTFPSITWSGHGSAGGLICSEPGDMRIISQFAAYSVPAPMRTLRDAGGTRRTVAGSTSTVRLTDIQVIGSRSEFWSPFKTKTYNQIMGAASFVGEVCCIETRHEANAWEQFVTNPVQVVMNLCDAPRK